MLINRGNRHFTDFSDCILFCLDYFLQCKTAHIWLSYACRCCVVFFQCELQCSILPPLVGAEPNKHLSFTSALLVCLFVVFCSALALFQQTFALTVLQIFITDSLHSQSVSLAERRLLSSMWVLSSRHQGQELKGFESMQCQRWLE